jgi:glycosyltransferase involved in cell wall biosynthesis
VPAIPAHGEAILTPYTQDPAKGMALVLEAAALAGVSLTCSKDLERDLAQARTLVYLTQSEGLGSGILLAMAYGVTVIATRTGGIPELIEDGVTGVLLQNEPGAVAEALVRKSSPDLGRAARQTVHERFTVAHMLRATLASYLRALND